MAKRNLPIGIEFYKKVIDEAYFYVDKTLIIKELLDRQSYVNLFTRPRRFGKTLALDMLKTFFEDEIDEKGNAVDNSRYFADKKIMDAGNQYIQHMGRYPVIYLSFKSSKQADWDTTFWMIKKQIAEEYIRHQYVLQTDDLLEVEKNLYRNIMSLSDDNKIYVDAIAFLSKCLERYHHQKVVILIDEYDVPLENAYFAGFYDEMTVFIRSLMESALKTNESLKLAVITGCLRISKESIFTGLNNLNVISVISDSFAEYFGFTEGEVADMLEYYELEDKAEDIKKWYDGYLFGQTHVYNPWSVISYLNGVIADRITYPRPYWANTSSNSIIEEMIEKAENTTRAELEDIMSGKAIAKPIHEDITYEDIYNSQDNLWNFLFFTGYLKAVDTHLVGARVYMTMAIPNMEVRYIYENTIMEWFRRRVMKLDLTPLHQALLNGKAKTLEELIKGYLKASISYYDENESFYHGFILGLMSSLEQYRILSNRETGNGRADILLKPYDEQNTAVIIELKYAKEFKGLEDGCNKALQQIETMHYTDELEEDGYQSILMYGICFYKKNCKVACMEYKN